MAFAEQLEIVREQGPAGITRFEASLEPDWIEQALNATSRASIRRRKIPADQAIWLVIAMGLFADRSIVNIVDHLNLVVPGVDSLAPSAVSQARYRLGGQPLEWLFEKVAQSWATETSPTHRWRGLSLHGVDGTCIRVADSDANFEHFGKPGGRSGANDAGYPQVRLACLMNLQTRLLQAAEFGPYATAEKELAAQLWSYLPDDSLTILDRGYIDYALFVDLLGSGTNRHLLVRMRANQRFKPGEVMADGTQLGWLEPSRKLRRARPDMAASIPVRVIEYQHDGGTKNRLFTTLLDPNEHPAEELIELYHLRWEIELGYDELKTHLVERRESLRSKRPDGVTQELWGLLLAYNLIRREMALAAEAHGVAPRRISFRSSVLWIRTFILAAAQMRSAGNLPKHLGEFRSTLDVLILPERRVDRRYPRHVKIKMSNHPRNRGKRHKEKLN